MDGGCTRSHSASARGVSGPSRSRNDSTENWLSDSSASDLLRPQPPRHPQQRGPQLNRFQANIRSRRNDHPQPFNPGRMHHHPQPFGMSRLHHHPRLFGPCRGDSCRARDRFHSVHHPALMTTAFQIFRTLHNNSLAELTIPPPPSTPRISRAQAPPFLW